jgi:hypothetical protein
VKTAQEMLDKIKSANNLILGISTSAGETKDQICDAAVRRNGAITSLIDPMPMEGMVKDVGKLLISLSEEDFESRRQLSLMLRDADSASDALQEISEGFVKLWNGIAEELKASRSQLAALADRAKFHAIHDERVREQVWAVTEGKCFYCEVALVRGTECQAGDDRANVFHVDHLVPKSAGGPDHLTNYVPSCQTCNISKSDKPVAVFMASRRQPKLTLVASS